MKDLLAHEPAVPARARLRDASATATALGTYVAITVGRLTDWFPSFHLAMIGAIVVLLLASSLPPLWPPMLRHPGARALLLLVALSLVSIPGSFWPSASGEFVFTVQVKVFLTFYFVVFCTRSTADARVVVFGLLAGLLILAVVTLATSTDRKGVTSTYDANDAAFVMNCALPLALHSALTAGTALGRVAAGLTSLLYVSTIVASESRGGFVALAVVAALVGFRLRRHLSGVVPIALVMATLMSLFFAPAAYWDRMVTIWAPGDITYSSYEYEEGGLWTARWTIWKTGLQLVLEHPLFGVGAGTFGVAEGLSHGGLGKWAAPHNSFLQVASELGVPALLVFVALLIGAIRVCRRVARNASQAAVDPAAQLASAVETSLYVYIVAGTALTQAYTHLLYVLLGLAATLPRLAGMTLTAPSRSRPVAVRSPWFPSAPAPRGSNQ